MRAQGRGMTASEGEGCASMCQQEKAGQEKAGQASPVKNDRVCLFCSMLIECVL
jgi:hypothetical protein